MNGLIKEAAELIPQGGALGSLALVLFFGVYLAVIVRTGSRKRDAEFAAAARLPLDDGAAEKEL